MAKPKLALIPATQGSKLYSVLPADGVGDFTFSRNSAATRINKDGLIETVASGKSRLNYPLIDGVVNGCPSHLLEPQRTNNVFYSQEVDNAYWLKSNCAITPNTSISPDGTLNADTFTSTAANSVIYKTGVTTGSLSFFAKDINLTIGNFTISVDTIGSANWDKNGNLVSVSGGNASNGVDYGNGWFRFSYNVTSGSVVNYGIANGSGNESILVFGLQNEPSSTYSTSYIPTTSSAVTRVAETANGAGDASTFNSSEGVLMAEISSLVLVDTVRLISINDGSSNNEIFIGLRSNTGNIYYNIDTNGSTQSSFISNVNPFNSFCKICIKYKENDIEFFVNGFKLYSDTSAIMPNNLNGIDMKRGNGSLPFYGNTKQIQYFDSALNDSDLEKITSWTSFTDLANGQTYSIK